MFLFVYRYQSANGVVSKNYEYKIINAYCVHTALVDFFDSVSKKVSVDRDMFAKMISNVSTDEAIAMFNAITDYEIKEIYKNLEYAYSEPGAL